MKSKNSEIRLFVEGYEVDLTEGESLKNGLTYGLASVKDISKKNSSVSKTIEIPGTSNNNQLFNWMFDVSNTSANFSIPSSYSAKITNNISGLSITGMTVISSMKNFTPDNTLGFSFVYPINNGGSSISFHDSIPSTGFYFTVTGNTDNSGYVICKLNGSVISTNKITGAVSTYFFPKGNYLFNDVLEIDFQSTFTQFSGNIKYAFNPLKKAKAYVYENGQEILSGYAKLTEATQKNKNVKYSLAITSEIGGFVSDLQQSRLEDLYTTQVPNLTIDSSGQTPTTITLPSPFDQIQTMHNITASWFAGYTGSVYYPLIDFGGNKDSADKDRSDLTINGTNFFTSVLRPCLKMMDYWNLIFESVGYQWQSNFLSSEYAQSIIVPYTDGNITCIDKYPITAITALTGSALTQNVPYSPSGNPVSGSSIYPFNETVTDPFNVYLPISESYTALQQGIYNISTQVNVNWAFTPSNTSVQLLSPPLYVTVQYDLYASGSSTPYFSYLDDVYTLPFSAASFNGNNYFTGISTTDTFLISFENTAISMNKGDFVKVGIYPAVGYTLSQMFRVKSNPLTTVSGTATMTIQDTSTLLIVLSDLIDGQLIKFKDLVPKSISCKEFIDTIIKTFDLYPIQDKDQPRLIHFYLRDEFFSNQTAIDWTNKLDVSSDITVKPVPELDAAQLLFSFKKGEDFWNKQYDSIYGGYSYGSLRASTGDQWTNKVKDILKGTLVTPCPSVQYDNKFIYPDTSIEILNANNLGGGTQTIISATGYNDSGTGTKILQAKLGVGVIYQGVQYTVDEVFNPYSFSIVNKNGNNPILNRPGGQVNGTYFATNDAIVFATNSSLVIPQIYESSDNNLTHKPTKSGIKLLHYKPIDGTNPCNPYWVQYTPYLVSGSYRYYGNVPLGAAVEMNQYPWCGHLDSITNPTRDLNYGQPIEVFFNLSGSYPTKNLFRYYRNTVNELADPASKYVECNLKLNSLDISGLDLSNPVSIDGTNFRVNEIKEYRADASSLTKCELIRQPYTQQVAESPIILPMNFIETWLPFTSSLVFQGQVQVDDSMAAVLRSTLWTQLSGPSATINNPGSPTSSFNVTITGSYVFQLTATDSYGYTGTGNVNVFVFPRISGTPEITKLTNSGDIIEPTSTSVTLSGSFIGVAGSVVTSSVWSQLSGPITPTITTPSGGSFEADTTITGLTHSGSYSFLLSITDNFGQSNSGSTSFNVTSVPLVTIQNNTAGVIAGESGITGFASTSVPAMTIVSGSHSAFTAGIAISFTSAALGATNLTLLKNGSLIQNIPITSGTATQTFTSTSFLSTDVIQILWG